MIEQYHTASGKVEMLPWFSLTINQMRQQINMKRSDVF
jgi:hypothetical protein